MKFFTPEWHGGRLSDEASDAVSAAYAAHLRDVLPRLHVTVRTLARAISLHDALVRRAVLDRPGRELRLELRCGDAGSGYFDLDLTYLGVVIDSADVAALAAAARDPGTELLYDEVDLPDRSAVDVMDRSAVDVVDREPMDVANRDADDAMAGGVLHRLLFWPYREVELAFDALALRLAPRANRRVPVFADRFIDVGAPAA